jgi:UDP-glucose 4-epimerase
MTVLITGGMGFIGTHTARKFLDAGDNVVITHYRVSRAPEFIADELGKRLTVETIDVSSPHDVLEVARKHNVESIVHLAVPGLNALRPAEEYRVNMLGLVNVLEAGRQLGMRRVSLASSLAVYGSVGGGPWKEADPLPIRSGGSTEAYKKAWETLAQLYSAQTGQDVIGLRLAGIYGPLYHSMANLPSRLCHAAVRGRALDLAGGRGGAPFEDDGSDMCYVKDCAAGIELVHRAGNLTDKSYNIGAGRAFTNKQLADAVAEAVPGFHVDLQSGRSPRARDDAYMDVGLAQRDAGYAPKYDIYSGVADYCAWLKDHDE